MDEIKIDRSFVGTMLDNNDDAAIVRSVIDLGRALGLTSIAEGAEDPQTYAGSFSRGDGGPELTLDAIDFCRVLSGRAATQPVTHDLLDLAVPF